ncbi:MAG TPA: TIGR03943 family protein, partial [Pseudonocardia sp.]|nr:TIGR03943 family protein [Pseudonocardia sp.]
SAELARLVISCCAADARPMTVRLTGAPDVPSGTWLRVRARLLPGSATVADGYTPSVRVLDAEPVPEPAEAYEY